MTLWLAIAIGCLYAAGIYMILRRSFVKLILGLALLGHATNLLIFTMGSLIRDRPPIIPLDQKALDPKDAADPIPQALILTAIVIGFGVLSFALALFHRAFQAVGMDDLDNLNRTDT